ncbi:bifunctional 2-polyprenyl-6-hydroxyphenol methylase/3-demethylubiquinol 3-O-methyltransferase UbiG [Sphingomicrobium sediminis]|uniref:Ubiquinone biosynthesis O-methyltransferase n=1 Tax=Sphingomicrobium sediminis TaxID=2950949 RepID=A0A9X2EGN5_9SPHN|nr:bifunctional 2-polyprenyl-6-hydroxyphenol methylase/3-demethylubiquinol 3-O-methyltransferase UbiG [Sphingomicrobium sediminis]MCM8557683.1 bifunctional 2-polyprenyl-6-hydroxyphenol methylase/3-demethylubiquinol 3-O-methyltransferase UbiG [Sphingomicrobium sediminis]
MAKTSILASEAQHFGSLAGDWWDPKGASAMLHKLNPVRLGFIREQLDRHFGLDECDLKPLAGKSALDIGCGAGLLAEPLARMGAKVTAVDAAPELIDAAKAHAGAQGLDIDYRAGEVAAVEAQYDLVTALEVIEHVADPHDFLKVVVSKLADDGLLILSTPNKTPLSKLLTITLAEGTGRIPRGTHDYDQFIPPEQLEEMLAAEGMEPIETRGIAFSPTKGLHLSEDLRLNYLIAARRV